MNVVAFAVTDAEGPPIEADFYGFEAKLIAEGPIASVVIESDEPPAATEETLLEYHALVAHVAERRACLPHRFGLVIERDRMSEDIAANADTITTALDHVRGREEWLVRMRVIAERAAAAAMRDVRGQPPSGDLIETGKWVHDRVAELLANDLESLSGGLRETAALANGDLHPDRLGLDIELVVDREKPDFVDIVDAVCEDRTAYAEFELFGPTPCYRLSDRLMKQLVG